MSTMRKKRNLPISERPEIKVLKGSLSSMSERDLLAVVLGSGVAGSNVKKIATKLIKKFGDNLLTAAPKELTEVKGIGPVKAARLTASFEFYRRLSDENIRQPIKNAEDVRWICQNIASDKQEIFGYLALDVRNRVIERVDLYKGTESITLIDPKQLFRTALRTGAVALIFFHNHPGGSKTMSEDDKKLAERLVEVGKILNFPILDFIIITSGGFHSLLGEYTGVESPSYAAEGGQQLILMHVLSRTIQPAIKQINQKDDGFTFIDLFAGIGGIRLAFEDVGGNCVFSCEWDKYAKQTYERNFGEIPYGDIRDITGPEKSDKEIDETIPDHHVLTAGFPCQPFSLAGVSKKNSLGRKHGFEDPTQGTLFFDLKRILKAKRPAAFLLENVKNLLHHDGGRTFEVIRKTLEKELGYVIRWDIVDAAKWVPQHRERVFIVGYNPDKIKISREEIIIPVGPPQGYKYPELNRIIQQYVEPKYILGPGTWDTLVRHKKHHAKMGHGFGYSLHSFPIPAGAVTRTISARYHKDGAEVLIESGGKRPRRLTIEEAARLQGFDPIKFVFPVSNTQIYRQIGNSVAIPAVKAAAREISKMLRERL